MKIAINGNRHQEGHLPQIDALLGALVAQDHRVVVADRFLDYLVRQLGPQAALGVEPCPLARVPAGADMALSFGGDGAFLKTARWVADSGIPVAGVNTGHLGYLADFSLGPDAASALAMLGGLLEGDYELEHHSLLDVACDAAPLSNTWHALNEVAVTHGDNASMITVSVSINGHEPLTISGDGVIVATPTGSTAYALSVGGPILDPALRGLVIAPVAPHSLAVRPMVVADDAVVDLAMELRAPGYRLSVDGRSITLPATARLRLSRAPYELAIVRHRGHSFIDTLRTKLGLGA